MLTNIYSSYALLPKTLVKSWRPGVLILKPLQHRRLKVELLMTSGETILQRCWIQCLNLIYMTRVSLPSYILDIVFHSPLGTWSEEIRQAGSSQSQLTLERILSRLRCLWITTFIVGRWWNWHRRWNITEWTRTQHTRLTEWIALIATTTAIMQMTY